MKDVMYEISMWRQLGGKDQGQLQMKLQSMLTVSYTHLSALEVTFFHKLAQTGAGSAGSFFALAICLPEARCV